jgi:muramidase (phage lysozyme)
VANISVERGTLVVEKERQEVVETIAAINEGNPSVKGGTLVMKSMEQIARESVPETTATQSLSQPFRDPRFTPEEGRQEVEVTELSDTTAASGVQSTDGKVDYKDPTEIPSLPDSLEVTGLTGAQQILEKIAIGEGATVDKLNQQKQFGIGTSKYDMVYNYGKSLAPSKPITQMTLSELFDFQNQLINATRGKIKGQPKSRGTSAVGKYQVTKTSLFGVNGTPENPEKNRWADKLNLTPDTIYSPEVQEKIGMLALREAGLDSFIEGTRNENDFQNRIANIWASVATSSGGDVHGQGVSTFKKDLMPLFQKVKDENKPDDFIDPTKVPEKRNEIVRPKVRPEQ